MKIVTVCKAGHTGQSRVALKFHKYLSSTSTHECSIIQLKSYGVLRRILAAIKLALILTQRKNNLFIVHLGIEGAILSLFFKKNIAYINHGLIYYPQKLNLLRAIYILVLRISVRAGAKVFFVNRRHANTCRSNLVFYNQPEYESLKPLKLKSNSSISFPSKVGFVGPLHGQKNNKILIKAIQQLTHMQFFHLSSAPAKEFKHCTNYNHFRSSERLQFFGTIHLLAIPSKYESFCLVAYEAQYLNLQVLHSGLDALMDLPFGIRVLANTENGWLHSISLANKGHFASSGEYKPDLSDVYSLNALSILNQF